MVTSLPTKRISVISQRKTIIRVLPTRWRRKPAGIEITPLSPYIYIASRIVSCQTRQASEVRHTMALRDVLERDPFLKTRTVFGSSFSDCERNWSIKKPKTVSVIWWNRHRSWFHRFVTSPVSLAKPRKSERTTIKITTYKSARKIVNNDKSYFMNDNVSICMNLARMKPTTTTERFGCSRVFQFKAV